MILANNIRHYIGGQDFGEPRNWQGLEIAVDWLNEKQDAKVNITDLSFVRKANSYLQDRILNGLTGGVGIFEGEPYTIKIGNPSSPVYTFEGYLDFTDDLTVLGQEEITASLKKKKGTDWLNDVADGFSFAYLYEQGVITNSDFKKVPYVINYVPDGMQLIVLSMSLFMMTKELIENIQSLADTIADVVDAATPVIGVGVGFGAVAVTAWDLGNFILVTMKAIARIAYIIAITIAMINLIEEIFEQLLPAKRYHLGMTFRKLLEKGCQHLGLNFSSSIQQLEWVHIPQKDKKGGSSGETGYPTNSGSMYTFGDAIRLLKKKFNADYRIQNGTFIFERKDYFEDTGTYKIPNVLNNQKRLLDGVGFNTNEIVANYNIAWRYDTQDQNTLDDQTGRVFQAITSPISTINADFVGIKNLAEVDIPFSIGKCKTELTTVEKVAKDLGKFVDNLTGIFGGGTNFASQIQGRLGSLLMSSHFTTYAKVVVMSGSKLANDQRGVLSAQKLWDDFHFINSFAEVNGVHNQYWRYPATKVPMNLEDFATLIENNSGETQEGERFILETLKYYPEGRYGIIEYRVKRKYTNNLKVEYV